jgi:hypothetical protein
MIKDIVYVCIILFVGWAFHYNLNKYLEKNPQHTYYDCRLAEFAPDFPEWARKECRLRRIEQYSNLGVK